MSAYVTLDQRIADAAQTLEARRRNLARHRSELQDRVVSEVRKSPVTAALGVLLLVLTWHRIRYRRRN